MNKYIVFLVFFFLSCSCLVKGEVLMRRRRTEKGKKEQGKKGKGGKKEKIDKKGDKGKKGKGGKKHVYDKGSEKLVYDAADTLEPTIAPVPVPASESSAGSPVSLRVSESSDGSPVSVPVSDSIDGSLVSVPDSSDNNEGYTPSAAPTCLECDDTRSSAGINAAVGSDTIGGETTATQGGSSTSSSIDSKVMSQRTSLVLVVCTFALWCLVC